MNLTVFGNRVFADLIRIRWYHRMGPNTIWLLFLQKEKRHRYTEEKATWRCRQTRRWPCENRNREIRGMHLPTRDHQGLLATPTKRTDMEMISLRAFRESIVLRIPCLRLLFIYSSKSISVNLSKLQKNKPQKTLFCNNIKGKILLKGNQYIYESFPRIWYFFPYIQV